MKPAHGAKVATFALSATATMGLAALFAEQDEVPATLATTSSSTTGGNSTQGTFPTSANPTTSPVDSSTTAADPTALADGVFVGEPDSNPWGTVQVQIVVSGGVVTDVQVLSFPDDDRRSENISERALPALTDEAIASQTAEIDSVSGATYTWQSYSVSLQSALDAAAAAVA